MKKIIPFFVILLLFGTTASGVLQKPVKTGLDEKLAIQSNDDGLMDSAWPMFCHDVRHTGRSPYAPLGNTGIEKWKISLTDMGIISSPAIDNNGTIYIGGGWSDKSLFAVNPNGTLKWSFQTGSMVCSSPAIGSDGIIYVGSNDGGLYAIFPNGTLKWRFSAGGTADWVFSSPAIGENGTIYFGVVGPGWNKGRLYALNPNGTKKWDYDTDDWIYCSPALDDNGIVYIGSNDRYMYAIYPNGTLKWKYKAGGSKGLGSAPTIGDDGTIYFGSTDGYLYALNSNGTLKWRRYTGYIGGSSPAIAEDGMLYVGTNGNNIFSIHPDGTENWRFTTGDDVISSPAIDKNGVIYVGSLDGTLYALSPYGSLRWKYVTGNSIEPSPAIGEDGTIYFGADYYLYAIEVKNAPDLRIEMKGKIARLRVDFKNVGNVDATNVNWSISVEITNWWDIPKRTLYSEGTIAKLRAGEKETRFAWPIFLFGYGFAIIDITVSAPDANNDKKEEYWLVFGPFIFPQP